MRNPSQLLRILNELVFVLLGVFIVFMGVSGRYAAPHHSGWWIGAGAILIYWGLRVWIQSVRQDPRWPAGVRAGSLAIFGAIVVGTSWLPDSLGSPLLAIGGGVLALRGLVSAVTFARTT